MAATKKILIADDHAIFREGLKQVVAASSPHLIATDEAVNGQETLAKMRATDYDLIILDISMPGRNGLDILQEIKAARPRLPVLVLSMHPEEQYAVRAFKSGAAGYLTKGSSSQELQEAVHKVMEGKKYISPSLADALVDGLKGEQHAALHEGLSNREYQVLCMIASGKPVGKIAGELSLSVKTISTYRAHILKKMHMTNNAELTRYAIENGLV